jgi:hypothetical protein
MRGKESGLIGKAVGLRAVVPKSAVRAAEERDADDPSSVVLELVLLLAMLRFGKGPTAPIQPFSSAIHVITPVSLLRDKAGTRLPAQASVIGQGPLKATSLLAHARQGLEVQSAGKTH